MIIRRRDDFRNWLIRVEAPRKAFAAIRGGHFAAFMNPSDFLKELGALLATAAR